MDFPRVTEVLRPFTNYEHVPTQILEKAAARGTSVHAICAAIAKEAWIPEAMIKEELVGYVNSFIKWSEAQVDKYLLIEKRFSDEVLEYTGQIDYVILGSDKNAYLVDLKTSARPQKTYPLQMAAYHHLLQANEIQVKGAMLVYLNKNGEFPEIQFLEDMSQENEVFLAALHCWHYFNKGKKNVRKNRISSSHNESCDRQCSDT